MFLIHEHDQDNPASEAVNVDETDMGFGYDGQDLVIGNSF